MQPDDERDAETRAWFTKAAADLHAADFELTADPPICWDVAFHAQQAAEKSMKGWLTWHGQVFRKTHNLIEIGGAIANARPSLEPLLRRAAPLSEYAWRFRYPGEPDDPSEAEARSAIEVARQLYGALLDQLPANIRNPP